MAGGLAAQQPRPSAQAGERAAPASVSASLAGPADAVAGAQTRLIDDEERGVFVVAVGPMEIPHMGHHDAGHAGIFPPVGTVTIPRDAYLYGFDLEIVDGQGRRLPQELLHHLNVIDPVHRELFLPIAQRMLALGTETGPQSMPRMLFGYPVAAGQPVVMSVMMHNPTGEHYVGVELRLILKYVPGGRPWPFFSVYPFQLDVAFPAGDKGFDLPPGAWSKSYQASPSMEGRLMVVGGHLHPYSTSLKLEDVTDNQVIWEGRPIEGPEGRLGGVTVGRLYWKLGARVTPDHVYRVTVTYNNPTGDTIPNGGMGLVAGVFMPSGSAEWPLADRANELYELDRKHFMREVRGRYGELVGAQVEPQAKSGAHIH
ncbi:MAG TPA: hypothetical protein VD793_03770 [Gemmatimonadales bacterium]|nr:hypothetical protein [Gemmatimonadales bacterium]